MVIGYNGITMVVIFLANICQVRRKCRERKANLKLQREARYKLDKLRRHNDSENPSLFGKMGES